VKGRLDYNRISQEEKVVDDQIRELFLEIEEDLRYRYVKYTSIYHQVLGAVLEEQGNTKVVEGLLPLHMFLEFGASQKVLISLMLLGLSRTSALLLQSAVRLNSDSTIGDCQKYLENVNLQRVNIPAICKAEIGRLQAK
jgi:hypothetical protein